MYRNDLERMHTTLRNLIFLLSRMGALLKFEHTPRLSKSKQMQPRIFQASNRSWLRMFGRLIMGNLYHAQNPPQMKQSDLRAS
jgi:hypothetical protein